MASRDFIQHFASANEPSNVTLGDEWFNTSTNRLQKRVAVSGTSVQWREVSGGVAVQQNGAQVTASTTILNFANATIQLDGTTGAVRISSSAAGSNTQVQFNSAGALAGSSNLTWDGTTFNVTGFTTSNRITINNGISSASWSGGGGLAFNTVNNGLTATDAGGTISARTAFSFGSVNFNAAASTTVQIPITLFVDTPVAGTNTSFSGVVYSLYSNAATRSVGLLVADTNIQQLAGVFYQSSSTAVSAAGTTQGTATALTNTINNVTSVAASSGVILPTVSPAGVRIVVRNVGANALNVYPHSGAQINSLGTNAAFSLAVNGTIEFIAVTTTQWVTLNTTYA